MIFFKRFFISTLLLLNVYLASTQSFSIEGRIHSNEPVQDIELLTFNAADETYQSLAKIPVKTDGQFSWQEDALHPNLYQLRIGKTHLLSLAVDQPEEIKIRLSQNDSGKWESEVKGSTGTALLRWFPGKLQQLQINYFGELKPKLDAALKANDQETVNAIEKRVAELFPFFVRDLKAAAVDSIGTSVAAYHAWDFIDPNKGLDIVEAIVAQFQAKQPALPLTRLLSRKLAAIQGLGIGVEAPGFELVDLEGKTIRLSDYRGRYVYVDFWASWCLACRAENPKLVNLFRQYSREDFTMLGVGIKDTEKAFRNAILKDKLPWAQARDVDHVVMERYHVMSLPQNVLLDPQGMIIARNVNAEELGGKLKEVLGE